MVGKEDRGVSHVARGTSADPFPRPPVFPPAMRGTIQPDVTESRSPKEEEMEETKATQQDGPAARSGQPAQDRTGRRGFIKTGAAAAAGAAALGFPMVSRAQTP